MSNIFSDGPITLKGVRYEKTGTDAETGMNVFSKSVHIDTFNHTDISSQVFLHHACRWSGGGPSCTINNGIVQHNYNNLTFLQNRFLHEHAL